MRKLILGMAAALFMLPVAAQAAEGYATANVNMRSGPSTRYPAVVVIPVGSSLEIHGCLVDTPWCDVSFYGGRGWVAGRYVQALYRQNRVYVAPEYYRPLGIPTVTFELGRYWDRNYRNRDFYRQRDDWRRGPDWQDRPRRDRDPPRFARDRNNSDFDRNNPDFDRPRRDGPRFDGPRVDDPRFDRPDDNRPRRDRDRPRREEFGNDNGRGGDDARPRRNDNGENARPRRDDNRDRNGGENRRNRDNNGSKARDVCGLQPDRCD